ncbi:sulfatase-like hydrolase/transferase [uncultured Arcticibacterium sp.]|uniref:sulfatase-like hydrolase/transferase n=1 Tax=uncultured Arcticibacterium sp. TaxID=2173042 RepID=UPI0030F7FFB7
MQKIKLRVKNKPLILCGLFIIYLFSISSFAQEPTVDKMPNIILIMADDLGREALGAYGGTSYKTPVLDKIASEGALFDHAYAYPLCTPTRVSLMTGKYNFRNWKAFGILDPNEKTIGHLMQEQGYKTCMVGKWQLQSYDPPGFPGSDLRRGKGMTLENAGFDEYAMYHTAHTEDKGSRFADPMIYSDGDFLKDTHNKYGPDVFVDFINDFIAKNVKQPFFVYYPMALTHPPFNITPDSKTWDDASQRLLVDKANFGDMVEYADKLVGKIIKQLEDLGVRDNTLLIFYTDNGTHQSIVSMKGAKAVQGAKGEMIDNGTRAPLILSWPGKINAQKSDQMVAPSDFIPTIFDVIGRNTPKGFYTDGSSFWPEILNKKEDFNRRDWVLIDHNPRPGWDKESIMPSRFVKGKRYKLYDDDRFYDIKNDELEQNKLVKLSGDKLKIKKKYSKILDSLRAYRTFGELKVFDPSFYKTVPAHTKIEVLGEGFTWIEGPVWVEKEQALLFSDVPRNVIYKWTESKGIELFLEKSGYTGTKKGSGSNGLAVDNDGQLLICRDGDREIARLISSYAYPIPVFQTLVDNYQGKRLNSPNDVIVDKKGNIYFTDPPYGMDPNIKPDLDFYGVYRLNLDGTVDLLVENLSRPNGLGLSPNESKLYVANSANSQFMVYDLKKETFPMKGSLFFDAKTLVEESRSKQQPDGLDINKEGMIFLAGPDGVLLIDPSGKHLGTIYTGKKTSNCVLSDDEKTLYVTCDDYILRVVLGYAYKKK